MGEGERSIADDQEMKCIVDWGQWRHSDIKDVAYFFGYKFFEKVIEKGELE